MADASGVQLIKISQVSTQLLSIINFYLLTYLLTYISISNVAYDIAT